MNKNFTKNSLTLLLLLIFCTAETMDAQEKQEETAGQNLVKWNAGALLFKNFSFQYERAVAKKISVAVGLRFAPKSGVPFPSLLEDLIDDEDAWNSIRDFKTGNFAITPEVRFYLGQGVFKGFYVAPFVRYATYAADVPYTFDIEAGGTTRTETMPLSGNVNTFTGGVLFGAQWKLSKLVYLDWWILGPNYGTSSGNISGKKNLSSEEQDALRDALTDLDDLPLVKTKYTVNSEGAKVDFDGPWAGLRSGLSIGFRF